MISPLYFGIFLGVCLALIVGCLLAGSSAVFRKMRSGKRKPSLSIARLSLEQRMKRVGLEFRRKPLKDIHFVPESIRNQFGVPAGDADDYNKPPVCRYCQCDASIKSVDGRYRLLHSEQLGYFCDHCAHGVILPTVTANRRSLGLPALDEHSLYEILNVLDREAEAKGLLKPEDQFEEQIPPVTFDTVLDAPGSYRQGLVHVRVDISAKTVTPIEAPPTGKDDVDAVAEDDLCAGEEALKDGELEKKRRVL